MKLEDLEFGDFREIEPNVMEIVIHDGIELRVEHIERIEVGLLEKYAGPYALLVDRVNQYSHTHGSMLRVARLRNLAALAILVHSDLSKHAAAVHELYQDNLRVFGARNEALAWLREALGGGA